MSLLPEKIYFEGKSYWIQYAAFARKALRSWNIFSSYAQGRKRYGMILHYQHKYYLKGYPYQMNGWREFKHTFASLELSVIALWQLWKVINNCMFWTAKPDPKHTVDDIHSLLRNHTRWLPRKRKNEAFTANPAQSWQPSEKKAENQY